MEDRAINQQQKTFVDLTISLSFSSFCSFSSSIPWKSYFVSKFSSSILFWTYSNQVFATFTSLEFLFSESFVSPTLLNSVGFWQSSSCLTYQQHCHSLQLCPLRHFFFSPAWQHITVVWFCSFNVLTVPFLFLSSLPYSPCPLNIKMFQVKILGSFFPSYLNS